MLSDLGISLAKFRKVQKEHTLVIGEQSKKLFSELSELMEWAQKNKRLPNGTVNFKVDEIYYHPEKIEYVITVSTEKRTVQVSEYDRECMKGLYCIIKEQLKDVVYVYLGSNMTLLYGHTL